MVTRKRSLPASVGGWALTLGLVLSAATVLSQNSTVGTGMGPAILTGRTSTLLSDGSILLLGGQADGKPLDTAALQKTKKRPAAMLPARLVFPRAWHTSTVIADGSVVIVGGVGVHGKTIGPIERFDPKTQTFATFSVSEITPRSHHTATLVSDGEVLIVGGLSADGQVLGDVQLWDPRTNHVTSVPGGLLTPRFGHSATLLPDGNVLIQGGTDANGANIDSSEIYDSTQKLFGYSSADESAAASQGESPTLAGSIPADGSTGVSVSTVISLRFSEPMQVRSIGSATITLANSGRETVSTNVTAAEGGRLAFVNPGSALAVNTAYTVKVDGVMARDGTPLAPTSITFTTAATTLPLGPSGSGGPGSSSGEFGPDGVWQPTSDWRTDLPPSPWQSLPPLQAPPHVTALAGQVLTLDGGPLQNVTIEIGKKVAHTNQSGRFLLTGLPAGHHVLWVEGDSANVRGRSFGTFEIGVDIVHGVTNALSYTIWMPALDTAHSVAISSPTNAPTVIGSLLMPGLDLHLPQGTVIRDRYNQPVRDISMTPVPLDRPPFPLPIGVTVPILFTIQPGGADLESVSGQYIGAQLFYPNANNEPPGTVFDFWNYDPAKTGWYVYGQGTVTTDGSQVAPNAGVEIYSFTGAMVVNPNQPTFAPLGPNPAPTQPQSCSGDSVDCSTGLLVQSQTDASLSDVIPINLKRTYRTADSTSRSFGIGATNNYDMFLTGDGVTASDLITILSPYTFIDLILPDGSRVYYPRISAGIAFHDAVYQNTSAPGSFFGSTIVYDAQNHSWHLQLRDGTVYEFPDSSGGSGTGAIDLAYFAALDSILDRHGNALSVFRDLPAIVSNKQPTLGQIQEIVSPNGRWLQFTYDTKGRITKVVDNANRTTSYKYDSYIATGRPTCSSTGMLCKVTDQNGGITSYTYDSAHRMLTMTDPRGNTEFTNAYDVSGRVSQQVLADGTSTWNFGYQAGPNGLVSATTITDPLGNIEKKQFQQFYDPQGFNWSGYLVSETLAMGSSVQQTSTIERDPATNLALSVTDQLGRDTAYGYDSLGNVSSITRLAGTSQALTSTFTYDQLYGELTSATDPIGDTYTITPNSTGDPAKVTDPLGNSVTLNYYPNGEVQSVADALSDTVQFFYTSGDLTSVKDPVGNVVQFYSDSLGRVTSFTDGMGQVTQYAYDSLDRLTRITDAKAGVTNFCYDANSNLLGLSDALHSSGFSCASAQTKYAYDSRNRLTTRTDGLSKAETYVYDADSNVSKYTDRNGNISDYLYDGLNREACAGFGYSGSGSTACTNPGSFQSTVNYTYDAGNRLTQAVDSMAGTIVRQYDLLDHLTEEQTPQGTVNYQYDNADRRSTMTVAGQSPVSYTWDNASRLTGITQGGSVVGISYDNANRRSQLSLPNGVVVNYGYDADSRVSGITYSANGNQIGNLAYGPYDGNSRLTGLGGSLAAVNLPQPVSVGAPNADNELLTFGDSALIYDSNGNLLNDGVNTYTWDARNRLTATAFVSAGTSMAYTYDAFGRRTSWTITSGFLDGFSESFLYDGLNAVQLQSNIGGAGFNLLTGLAVDENFTVNGETILTDALGSVFGTVGTSGIDTTFAYDPFGNTTSSGQGNGGFWQFTGRENDLNGLYYYRARYYSPTLQRFISQDPLGFGGGDTNLYAYVGGDPVNYRDPTGDGRVGAVVGGTIGGVVGLIGEGSEGAALGTVVEPGGGSIAGAAVGAVLGATRGATTGAEIGSSIEDAIDGKISLRRPYIRQSTRQPVEARAPRDETGCALDPYSRKPIPGKPDFGHKYGREFWREKKNAEIEGLTQQEFNDRMNDPDLYQLEDPSSNRSRVNEMK